MSNFLKIIKEKKGWYSGWHKNRSGGTNGRLIFYGSLFFILMAFVYRINIMRLPVNLLNSLSLSMAGDKTASLVGSVAPADTAATSTDTTAPTDTNTSLTDAATPTDATTPLADTATATPAEAAPSLIDTTVPADNTSSADATGSPAENTAPPTTPLPAQPNVQQNIPVVQSPPVITKVTSPILFGNFKSGVIPIMVLFDKPVVVSGSPQLILSTGNPATTAADYKFSFRNLLLFSYHISPGNNSSDLDYNSSSALFLNGGEIKDASGNAANLALPEPGSKGSLSGCCNIVIGALQ